MKPEALNHNKQQIRYAGNTAYHHSLWDRYDLLSVLNSSQELLITDSRQRKEFWYSFVQDAYYALLGNDIRSKEELGFNVEGVNQRRYTIDELWRDLTNYPQFENMVALFNRNPVGRVTAVYYTARAAEQLTRPLPPEQCQGPGQDSDPWQEVLDEENQEGQPNQQQGDSDNGESKQSGPQEGQSQGNQPSQDEQEQGSQLVGQGSPQQGPGQGTAGGPVPLVGPVGREYNPPRKPRAGQPQPPQDPLDSDEAENKADVMSSLMPYVGPGNFTAKYDNVDKLILENRFQPKELARYLGFVHNAVRGVHREDEAASGSLTGYRRTEWSEKLHPVDMVGVATGNLATLAKLAEGNLRSRKYETKRPMGRGPVVILRDESGSMKEPGDKQGHSKNEQAKMLEIALAISFNEEKRELISIAWDNVGTRQCIYGQDDVRAHLSKFFDGGTELRHALRAALEAVEEYVEGADILILTDGDIGDDDPAHFNHLLAEFRKANGRVWYVHVGREIANTMAWVDGKISINDIGNSAKLSELIAAMNRKQIQEGAKVRL